MGYYIHSCSKMRYKARFGPSDLLCPVTYGWVPHADCTPILDKSKFAVLNSGSEDGDGVGDATDGSPRGGGAHGEIDSALFLYRRTVMPYYVYRSVKTYVMLSKCKYDRTISSF